MNHTRRTWTPVFALLVGLASSLANAQDAAQVDPAELAKPGEEHAQLKALIGDWKVEQAARGQTLASGDASALTILGGRFLVIDGKLAGQQKSEFRYTLGYDRRNAEYEITLLDTAGTYSVSARGKPLKDDKQKIRMFGKDNDPMMKRMGIDKKFAFDLKLIDADKFEIETIYVDNRTDDEKLIPAFKHIFVRK